MRWRDGLKAAARAARLMVGVPDYEVYAAHRRAAHPGEPVMSRAEFHRERTERRYGGGPDRIGRCC
ncbi:YbdD/YjiX family protein [Sphingomonas parva]|uniref:YbdD/YjiX family protein n=1 Tax=Sphingomonas parva TaxID=2555898 RepID=A0A4Y8ZY65_9SPHN|nr:CstA-like transporter-associated (seleno)protein [Sphingomonas parva]TFI59496.1 YbdD/YjiX family protein [Sphingomonas parva]